MNEVKPRLLLLETSGRVGQVALAQGSSVLRARCLDEARRHARDLVPAVAELLAQQNWKPSDIQAVVVSRGPGSYTGLRVGIMSAKTFAYATGCTLLAVDTFAAVALQAPASVQRLYVIADAQQEKVYVQRFVRSEKGDRPGDFRGPVPFFGAETALRIEGLRDWLADYSGDVWITGPGLHVYGNRLPTQIQQVEPSRWDATPQSLLHLALPRFLAGERDDVWGLEPLYLRPSSAEEKWQARATFF